MPFYWKPLKLEPHVCPSVCLQTPSGPFDQVAVGPNRHVVATFWMCWGASVRSCGLPCDTSNCPARLHVSDATATRKEFAHPRITGLSLCRAISTLVPLACLQSSFNSFFP